MNYDSNEMAVHRSTTRRKACSGCVRAKRRCDLTIPICSRCRGRNLICTYVGAAPSSVDPTPSTTSSVEGVSPLSSSPLLGLGKTYEFENMASFNTPYLSFALPPSPSITTPQLDYCVSQLKQCLVSLVRENRTLFIHPLSCKDHMSSVYEDVLGVCSLYMHKTSANKDTIFQIMDRKVDSLMQSSVSSSGRLEDNLLALQALLLYQIIRLFDGDIRQRANAERQFYILDSWTLRLQASYFSAEQTKPSTSQYHHWILLESIRRSILISIFLREIYSFMKDSAQILLPLLSSLPVSSNSELWDQAPASSADSVAEPVEPQELITYADFAHIWSAGSITSFGEYEKTLLAACYVAYQTDRFKGEALREVVL